MNSGVYETRRSGWPEAPVSRKENMKFLSAAAPLDLLFKDYICWGFFFFYKLPLFSYARFNLAGQDG